MNNNNNNNRMSAGHVEKKINKKTSMTNTFVEHNKHDNWSS